MFWAKKHWTLNVLFVQQIGVRVAWPYIQYRNRHPDQAIFPAGIYAILIVKTDLSVSISHQSQIHHRGYPNLKTMRRSRVESSRSELGYAAKLVMRQFFCIPNDGRQLNLLKRRNPVQHNASFVTIWGLWPRFERIQRFFYRGILPFRIFATIQAAANELELNLLFTF